MQLGRKLAEGYAVDSGADEISPPVVEAAAESRVEVETVTEPVRA